MRVGIDATSLPVRIAGAGRYICGLLSGLSEVDRVNDYFVFVKQQHVGRFRGLARNFHLVVVPDLSRPSRVLWQKYRPRHLVKEFKLQVWHSPHYVLPAGLESTHSVVTLHDMTFFLFPRLYSPVKRYYFQREIRNAIQGASTLVAVSEATGRDARALFPQISDRLHQIYSGLDTRFCIRPSVSNVTEFRRQFGERFILFVGTLEKRKNLSVLLQAFHDLAMPQIYLVLAGQPESDIARVRRQVGSLGISERVFLPGYLPDDTLPALYSAASAFVFPSQYEGFGFPVLEAMASGTPVLTSCNSAMRELSGLAEMQIDPSDVSAWTAKMRLVLENGQFRARLVEHGLARARQFSWRDTAEQMVKVYERRHTRGPTPANSNGAARVTPLPVRPEFPQLPEIQEAILRTLAFSDLFGYPLTRSEIHVGLVGKTASLTEVICALDHPGLRGLLAQQDGYFFLKGGESSVRRRRFRENVSTRLLQRHRWLLRIVCNFPFAEAVMLSGAVAFKNSGPEDDIDLFIIANPRRIWSLYFSLALLLKMVGKRKLICLNYIFAKSGSIVDDKDFFVAHQIANLRLLSGTGVYDAFRQQNGWIKQFLPQACLKHNPDAVNRFGGLVKFVMSKPGSRLKRMAERVFESKLFDVVETLIFRWYGGHLRGLTAHLNGSVRVERDQIKLFTNDHRARTLERFSERLTQVKEESR